MEKGEKFNNQKRKKKKPHQSARTVPRGKKETLFVEKKKKGDTFPAEKKGNILVLPQKKERGTRYSTTREENDLWGKKEKKRKESSFN